MLRHFFYPPEYILTNKVSRYHHNDTPHFSFQIGITVMVREGNSELFKADLHWLTLLSFNPELKMF